MRQIAVIYVPGLGDKRLTSRQRGIDLWRYSKVTVELCPMKWYISEPWSNKYVRLVRLIELRRAEGKSVTLIGESAGASAVMTVMAARPELVDGAILLCGKFMHPDRVAKSLYRNNPAFHDAISNSADGTPKLSSDARKKILNLHPLLDPVVPVKETRVAGITDAYMPMIGHAASIVFALTLWSWRMVAFARKQAL
jgi:pimeloyl-ACP methyl ester carboxylesterase